MAKNKANTNHKSNLQSFILTLVITLIALTAVVFTSFYAFYSIAKEDTLVIGEKGVSDEAEKLNNFLLKGLDVVQITGEMVDYMIAKGYSTDEIQNFLVYESESYSKNVDPSFTGVYGWIKGEYLDGTLWVPDDDYVPVQRPWYKIGVKGKGKPVMVSPYLDAKTDSIMVSVSQLLSDGESVVSLDIVMDGLDDYVRQIQIDGNGYGFILDRNGLVVADSSGEMRGKNYIADPSLERSEMGNFIKKIYEANGKSFATIIDNEERVVFSKIVQDDWFVVTIVNTSDLFKRVQDILARNIILMILIYALVVYFCTSNFINRTKSVKYALELENYKATLEERVAEQTKEIKKQANIMLQMQENVVEGMATLIESRDGNTGEHVRNTKKYVSLIVNYMLEHNIHPEIVNENYAYKLCNAAPLHDVGKIMISDTILNKPGKFTDEEFEIMKTHSKIGSEIVENILGKNVDKELIEITSDVAHFHHEKWNGNGYPEKISGENIPLSARIMAVADVFDALVSKRVYKDSFLVDTAFEILKKDSGSHFDPEIVDIFFKVRDKVEEYLETIKEK